MLEGLKQEIILIFYQLAKFDIYRKNNKVD